MSISKRFNLEYTNIWQDAALSLLLRIRIRNTKTRNNHVLIVAPSLIGEFAAIIEPIRDYIHRHPEKSVDLLVSQSVKDIAACITGVHHVYATNGSIRRIYEVEESDTLPSEYDEVILLRVSETAYRMLVNVHANTLHTFTREFTAYGLHLLWSVARRKVPMQWRDFNFGLLGGAPHDMEVHNIFSFSPEDSMQMHLMIPGVETEKKKIILHIQSNWRMKNWNLDNWISLIEHIKKTNEVVFFLVGTQADLKAGECVCSRLNFPVQNLMGKVSLKQLLVLMTEADYFIGIDSGPGNIAHVAHLPSLILYGPGPHMYLPWTKRDIYITKSRGRGLYQMFFAKKKGFIDCIEVDEVDRAFRVLTSSHNGTYVT